MGGSRAAFRSRQHSEDSVPAAYCRCTSLCASLSPALRCAWGRWACSHHVGRAHVKHLSAGAARQVFDEALRKSVPHVTRWWLTLAHQPAFAAVLGEVKLCEQPMAFTAPKKEAGAKADGAAREPAPKKEKAPKMEPAPKVRRAGRAPARAARPSATRPPGRLSLLLENGMRQMG